MFEISKMIELFTGSTTAEVAKHHEQSEATPGGGQAQVRPSTVSRSKYLKKRKKYQGWAEIRREMG